MTWMQVAGAIRQQLEIECARNGGPDCDNTTMKIAVPCDDDPALKAVLLAKGKLVIELTEVVQPVDNNQYLQGVRALRESVGAELPVGMVGGVG